MRHPVVPVFFEDLRDVFPATPGEVFAMSLCFVLTVLLAWMGTCPRQARAALLWLGDTLLALVAQVLA